MFKFPICSDIHAEMQIVQMYGKVEGNDRSKYWSDKLSIFLRLLHLLTIHKHPKMDESFLFYVLLIDMFCLSNGIPLVTCVIQFSKRTHTHTYIHSYTRIPHAHPLALGERNKCKWKHNAYSNSNNKQNWKMRGYHMSQKENLNATDAVCCAVCYLGLGYNDELAS